jgi:hypothetical protein
LFFGHCGFCGQAEESVVVGFFGAAEDLSEKDNVFGAF